MTVVPSIHSRSLRLLLSLGVVLGLGATFTQASWTDNAAVSGTTITAGRVDLRVQDSDAVNGFTAMNAAGMYPGDTTAAVLTVRNNANIPLQYRLTSSVTNADGKGLGAALTAKVTGDAATSGSGNDVSCAGTALADTTTAFGGNLAGTAGSQRLLGAGASETLCVQATLPSSAAQTLSSAATDITFSFAAASPSSATWTDNVTVTGTTIGTGTPAAPTVTCGAIVSNGGQAGGSVTLNWTSVSRAIGYRLFYNSGATTQDVPSTTSSRTFTDPAQGTFWVRTRYPGTWISPESNTRNYKAASDEQSCS